MTITHKKGVSGRKLSLAEYESDNTHQVDGQTTNDMLYFNGTYWVRATAATIDGVLNVVRSATLVVAASNASTTVKAQSDYVCDGAADDVEIQAANDALPVGGGRIILSEGTFTLGSVTLDGVVEGQGESTILYITDNATSITLEQTGRLRNLRILCTSTYTGTAVIVEGTTGGSRHGNDVLDKVTIWHAGSGADLIQGTGILIRGIATASSHKCVSLSSFGSIYIYGFEYGVKLYATDSGAKLGYVNGNIFRSLVFEVNKNPLYLEGVSTAHVSGNIFQSVEIQPSSSTVNGIHVVDNSNYNIFLSVFAWDWGTASGSSILIDAGVLDTYAKGYLPSNTDNGTRSTIIDTSSVTKNSGTATVANGQTTVTVTHGLAATPTRVQVTPTLLSNATSFWVTAKGATTFVINVNADPGAGTATFDWKAQVGEG